MVRFVKRIGLGLVLCCTTASADVMLGAYVPGDGFSRESIASFNAVVPKPLAFINVFTSFSHDWNYLYWQSSNIVAEGAMPLISWMPVDLNRPNDNILLEIAVGLRDDYIDQWGEKLLAWVDQYPVEEQPKILLRFGHEFNGNWYSYGNSPMKFQAAWQYIHDRFETAGVNQHVEWVWSANNVSVDDYDDMTAYYPGAEYVDWTSIDGYNFGSNYSWTDWESFEETYSDSYLTMVNNYPEKPILIAEVGSAEENDVPNRRWGQFGDNADAYESKSDWIADMLRQLEISFPAVRGVTWFNTNKELGWSLTNEANTGLSSYISGVSSNHYTSDFLSARDSEASQIDTEADLDLVLPTELELAAVEAAKSYELVQTEFETAEADLNEAKNFVEAALLEKKRLVESRAGALSEMRESGDRYISSRNAFLAVNNLFLDSREDFVKNRTEMVELRSLYLSAGGKVNSARTRFLAKRSFYLEKRQNFLDSRLDYINTRASMVDAVATLEAAKDMDSPGLVDLELLKATAEEARELFLESVDKFLLSRSEFLVTLDNFRDVGSELTSAAAHRRNSSAKFAASIGVFKRSRDVFLTTLEDRKGPIQLLSEERKSYLTARSRYVEVHGALADSIARLDAKKKSCDIVELAYQQAVTARSEAYQVLTNANYLVSLEGNSVVNHLLLADDANGNQKDKVKENNGIGNGTGNSNGKGQVTAAESNKKLVSIKKINKDEQVAIAKSKQPKAMAAEKLAERKLKYKNMSPEEKSMLKQRKLSSLIY